MPIAQHINKAIQSGSLIRAMFEAGIAMAKERGAENVFDFSLGNPDVEPPVEFTNALREIVSSNDTGTHGYMTNNGYEFVRKEMAAKVALEHNVKAEAKDIVMTVGAAGALNVIMKTILNPNDEVIVLAPFFGEYTNYIGNYNGVTKVVETNEDFSINLEAVKKALNPKTAAIIINSPNNPTGRIYPEKDLKALCDVLKAHGETCKRAPYLVIDEPYRDIVYDNAVVPALLCLYKESFVGSSFSKSLSVPGERIGYIAVNPEISDKETVMAALAMCNRTLGFVNAPAIAQRAVAKSWRSHADIDRYAKRRAMLTKILDDCGIEYAKPEGAFYLFCKIPEGKCDLPQGAERDKKFISILQDEGVLGVPGAAFAKTGWFRLCYCVPEKTITNSAVHFKATIEKW